MNKLTFRNQLITGVVIVVVGFIVSTFTKQEYFSNIGWMVYGLLFFVNPVYPESIKTVIHTKIYLRLVGLLIIISTFFIHFGF